MDNKKTRKNWLPNMVQIPRVFFTEIMATLSPSEQSVFLVILFKTFGWGKDIDKISNSQFVAMTGLSRSTIKAATKSLHIKKIIVKTQGKRIGHTLNQLTKYEVNNDSFSE